MKIVEILESLIETDTFENKERNSEIKEAITELKAKDEAYAKLQQAYDNLTAKYQKDVNELKTELKAKDDENKKYREAYERRLEYIAELEAKLKEMKQGEL